MNKVKYIGLAGILALGGCRSLVPAGNTPPVVIADPAPPPDASPDPVPLPAQPPALPVVITQTSESFFGTVKLPDDLQSVAPRLDARLRQDAEDDLTWMQAEADAYKAADPDYFRPYSYGKNWTLLHASGDLVSLKASGSQYTGGAHANHFIYGLVHDRTSGEDVYILDLFADRQAIGARLVDLVRAAILEQKREKYAGIAMSEADLIADVEAGVSDRLGWARQSALVAAADGAGFGGIDFYFSPYELGAYAEGSYIARIPQSEFRDLLKSDNLPMFTSDPASNGEDAR